MSDFINETINSPQNYRFAVAHEEMNSRRRNTMEDCHRIIPVMDENNTFLRNVSYFGIYDGHGGRQIVDYLENALEQTIAQELTQTDTASMQERLTRFDNSSFILFFKNASSNRHIFPNMKSVPYNGYELPKNEYNNVWSYSSICTADK